MGFENNELILGLENDKQALRAALQQALDFAAGKEIPPARTRKRWDALLVKTLNS